MEEKYLTDGEARFMQIIWAEEPVPSGRLVQLCLERLGWKKSTTYTMLKRLAEKGCVRNDGAVVTALRSRAAVGAEALGGVGEENRQRPGGAAPRTPWRRRGLFRRRIGGRLPCELYSYLSFDIINPVP